MLESILDPLVLQRQLLKNTAGLCGAMCAIRQGGQYDALTGHRAQASNEALTPIGPVIFFSIIVTQSCHMGGSFLIDSLKTLWGCSVSGCSLTICTTPRSLSSKLSFVQSFHIVNYI